MGADIQTLTGEQALSVFRMQDTQVQYETVNFQLQSAKAAQVTAKLALDSEIGGVNTTELKSRRSSKTPNGS